MVFQDRWIFVVESKVDMEIEFKMKDIDMMHYFLGLEVWQRSREIFFG
jgi:hypothetical protein